MVTAQALIYRFAKVDLKHLFDLINVMHSLVRETETEYWFFFPKNCPTAEAETALDHVIG